VDLQRFLTWHVSALDPRAAASLLAGFAALTLILIQRPHWYLPLVLITAPLPKLFTIGYRNEVVLTDWIERSDPGFSIPDVVLAAGLAAVLLRGRGTGGVVSRSRRLSAALVFWSASIGLSVAVGLIMWAGVYRPANAFYAARYLLTLAAFGVAVHFARRARPERLLTGLLNTLSIAGNITLVIGLLYYFFVSAPGGGSRATILLGQSESSLFRNYLWFFDYGNDMGFYAATLAILNTIQILGRPGLAMRVFCAVGIVLCVVSILLIGQRANPVVLVGGLAYLVWEAPRARRLLRLHAGGGALTVMLLAIAVVSYATLVLIAPTLMLAKLHTSVGRDYAPDASVFLAEAGVPAVIGDAVAGLPIGDNVGRLSFIVASLWFFLAHPLGVGFWGELQVAGWYAHHEIVKIAVEQGVPGLFAFFLLTGRMRRLLWCSPNSPGAHARLGLLLRASSVGLFAALIAANTVLLDMKFAIVYWTLLGVWSGVPLSGLRSPLPKVAVRPPCWVPRKQLQDA